MVKPPAYRLARDAVNWVEYELENTRGQLRLAGAESRFSEKIDDELVPWLRSRAGGAGGHRAEAPLCPSRPLWFNPSAMNETPTVLIRLLGDAATLPMRATARAAGYDLFASEATTVPASRARADGGVAIGRAAVPTGIALAIPEGLYGRVAPRSGLAFRRGVDVGAGVVDGDFRDELRVLLFNFTDEPFEVRPGDRIAQIIFERVAAPHLVAVDELDETGRGGGFGSTGLR